MSIINLDEQLQSAEKALRDSAATDNTVGGAQLAEACAMARDEIRRYETTLLKLKGSFAGISKATDAKVIQKQARQVMTELLRAG